MASIIHFDVPAEEINRAKTFYEKLFDWKITPVADPMEYYDIITKDKQGKQGLAGGMGIRGAPDQRMTNYIGVDSVDEYIEKVKELGGKITMPKMTVPGFVILQRFFTLRETLRDYGKLMRTQRCNSTMI